MDINQSPGGRKTTLANVIKFLSNPHELDGPCSWEKEDLSYGGREEEDRNSIEKSIIIESLFECWILGSVFKSNWVPCDQLCS
ncbi:hypothetical protein AVEN_133402-1 [Araneus ventricosus]|uniref:Uncharacterized protein n=1 Tax=Araneus ventricosus TaxID=182803 RepID=A0A4Y2VNL8_ARAVE|nr:hypothetical protein AVEN_133402-1 [Araneus ventricosus]